MNGPFPMDISLLVRLELFGDYHPGSFAHLQLTIRRSSVQVMELAAQRHTFEICA